MQKYQEREKALKDEIAVLLPQLQQYRTQEQQRTGVQVVKITKGDSHYDTYIRFTTLKQELKELKEKQNLEISQVQSRIMDESSLFRGAKSVSPARKVPSREETVKNIINDVRNYLLGKEREPSVDQQLSELLKVADRSAMKNEEDKKSQELQREAERLREELHRGY